MKSLRYILTGRPASLDDCMDLARRVRPESVKLKVRACDFLSEQAPMTQFVARLRWTFPELSVRTEFVCGSVRADAPVRQRALAQANRRLEQMLARLQSAGLNVLESDQRFESARHKTLAAAC